MGQEGFGTEFRILQILVTPVVFFFLENVHYLSYETSACFQAWLLKCPTCNVLWPRGCLVQLRDGGDFGFGVFGLSKQNAHSLAMLFSVFWL